MFPKAPGVKRKLQLPSTYNKIATFKNSKFLADLSGRCSSLTVSALDF